MLRMTAGTGAAADDDADVGVDGAVDDVGFDVDL